MDPQVFFVIITSLYIGSALGGKFSSQCVSNADCPGNAECVIRGCEGRICLCRNHYMPTDNYTECIKMAELGQPCGNGIRCRGIRSRCGDNGICQCQNGYTLSNYSKGNDEIVPRCKTVLTDRLYALLGEECNPSSIACEGTETECVNGACACKQSFRSATLEEINAYPFNFFQCVKDNFKLTPAHPPTSSQVFTSTNTPPLSAINGLTSGLFLTSVAASANSFTPSISAFSQTVSSESFGSLTNMSTALSSSFNSDVILSSVLPTTVNEFYSSESITVTSKFQSFSTMYTTTSTTPHSLDVTTSDVVISPSSEFSIYQTGLFPPQITTSQILLSASTSANLNPILKSNTLSSLDLQSSEKTFYTDLVQTDLSAVSSILTTLTMTSSPLTSGVGNLWTTWESSKGTATKANTVITPSPRYTQNNVLSSRHITDNTDYSQTSGGYQTPSSIGWHGSWTTNQKTSLPTTETTIVISTKPVMVSIGEKCSRNLQCPSNSACDFNLCNVQKCRCVLGFVADEAGKKCVPLVSLGSPCQSDVQCIGPKTRCHNNACICVSGYIQNNDKSRCKRETSWFVAFPLLHEKCKNFFADCYNDLEQQCAAGRCQCRSGLREATLNDTYTNQKSYKQCINSTVPIGSRKPSSCDGDLVQFEDDPSSDEAHRKINVMKGAIIGGICGFVVLIAIVVAVILLVRHKRRTKVRHIRTDTISVSSFDRRSSGKYSYRLPRSFAFNLGKEKEWEAEHLSVHNSEFEPNVDNDTVLKDTADIPSMNGTFSSHPVDVTDEIRSTQEIS